MTTTSTIMSDNESKDPEMVAIAVRLAAALIMIALPLGIGWFLTQQQQPQKEQTVSALWRTNLPYLARGAACFVASQIIHIPLLQIVVLPLLSSKWGIDASDTTLAGKPLILLALVLGLMAGICEEVCRWIFLFYQSRLLKDQADKNFHSSSSSSSLSFWNVVWFGIGHGGCEAILVGLIALSTLPNMIMFRTQPNVLDEFSQTLTETQMDQLQHQITEYWNAEASKVILGPLERFFAMTLHVALSLQVWKCFEGNVFNPPIETSAAQPQRQREQRQEQQQSTNYSAVTYAIGLHTGINAAAVIVVRTWGLYATELVLGLVSFPFAVKMIFDSSMKMTEKDKSLLAATTTMATTPRTTTPRATSIKPKQT